MQLNLRSFAFTLLLAASVSGFADSSLWFSSASDALGTPLTSITVGGIGSTFDVAVWYSSDSAASAMEILTSIDRTSTEGIGATPVDGMVGLNGTAATATSDLSSGLQMLGSASLAGGYSPTSGDRGYGLDFALVGTGFADIASTSGRRLFTLKLMNTGISAGQGYSLSFHTPDDSGSLFSTYIADTNSNVIVPTTSGLRVGVQAVPEPASMLALAGGVAALLRRRRKG